MRTTAEEMAELGARIGRKAAAATGPAEVFWPERGVSALDADGQPFWDPVADAACLEALDRELTAAGRALRRVDAHINDPLLALWPGCAGLRTTSRGRRRDSRTASLAR